MPRILFRSHLFPVLAGLFLIVASVLPQPVGAFVTAFRQAVAEAAASDDDIAAFYRARGFEPIWTRTEDAARRNALLEVLEEAGNHALPVRRYDPEVLRQAFRDADTPRARGQVEVLASTMFLQYARDVHSGLLEPGEIVDDIVKVLPRRDRLQEITDFAEAEPREYLRALPPDHPEYRRLMREMLGLERVLGQGGWGPEVWAGRLEIGDQGDQVIALRDRLMAMGYLDRVASASYDGVIQTAVQAFQIDHGLEADGVAGPTTLEAINVSAEFRLEQVMLAMERRRWMNIERGSRHVLVNIPDYHAFVVDDEVVTFDTRVVVGAQISNQHTPEFSDMMEHMVINPSWYVPRSITVAEYLPQMQVNPTAAGHLQLIDGAGNTVSRAGIDFSQYTGNTFPYDLRQPPSNGNALGLVKFMFPNRWNIYLHDTPSRHLFAREARAFSHGCVRVARPFELAYHLLAPQVSDPESYFQSILRTGQETQVNLETPIPVHIVYWTAFVTPEGRVNYRNDVYRRDRDLWRAMLDAGVELRAVTS